jgi:hypothetical protein
LVTVTERPQKITLREMRASGVRGLLIYCADYKCGHWIKINADLWPDRTRQACHDDDCRLVVDHHAPPARAR